jgi:hypothetical protein
MCGDGKLRVLSHEKEKESAYGAVSNNHRDDETWYVRCENCDQQGKVTKTTSVSSGKNGINGVEIVNAYGCAVRID